MADIEITFANLLLLSLRARGGRQMKRISLTIFPFDGMIRETGLTAASGTTITEAQQFKLLDTFQDDDSCGEFFFFKKIVNGFNGRKTGERRKLPRCDGKRQHISVLYKSVTFGLLFSKTTHTRTKHHNQQQLPVKSSLCNMNFLNVILVLTSNTMIHFKAIFFF
jgi:hypothetical protein